MELPQQSGKEGSRCQDNCLVCASGPLQRQGYQTSFAVGWEELIQICESTIARW